MTHNQARSRGNSNHGRVRPHGLSAAALAALSRRRASGLIPQLNKEITNEAADSLRVLQNRAHLRRKLKASRPSFFRRDHPVDDVADRDLFQEAQRSLADGDTVRFARRAGGLVEQRTYPIHAPRWEEIEKEKRKRRRKGQQETILLVPDAYHTGPLLKALSWTMALSKQEDARAFTLHLHPDVIEKARRSKAFATTILAAIQLSLKKVCDRFRLPSPELFFCVEKGELDVEHLHGVITIPPGGGSERLIRGALLSAAGFCGMAQTGRELKLSPLHWAPGWARYLTKWSSVTEGKLGSTPFAATQATRRLGRDWYVRARAGEHVLLPAEKHRASELISLDLEGTVAMAPGVSSRSDGPGCSPEEGCP